MKIKVDFPGKYVAGDYIPGPTKEVEVDKVYTDTSGVTGYMAEKVVIQINFKVEYEPYSDGQRQYLNIYCDGVDISQFYILA